MRKHVVLTLAGACCCLSPLHLAAAEHLVESFELGTWSDWTLSVELDSRFKHYFTETFPEGVDYPFPPETNPYILDDIEVINDPSAAHGAHSLRLTPGGGSTGHHAEPRSFVGPDQQTYTFLDRSYRVSLSRELHLESGHSLSLYADFYTEDYPPYDADDLQIRINGAPVFELSVADVFGGFPEGWGSGWTPVVWTAPATGNYTLSLCAFQDDQAFSSASFDYLVIIPEPTTSTLIGLGALAFAGSRRRKQVFPAKRQVE